MNTYFNLPSAAMKVVIGNLLLVVSISLSSFAQRSPAPKTGQPSPDFSLNVLLSGKGKPAERTLESYRGKWLVLDFWSKSCLACIKGFPKLQAIKDSLEGTVNFILIGKNDEKYNAGIEKMYHRIAKEERLTLDIAFDTTVFKSYGVWATPHLAIISTDGKLHSVTTGEGLNFALLRSLTNQAGPSPLAKPHNSLPIIERKTILDTLSEFPHQSEIKTFSGSPVMGAATLKLYPASHRFITRMSNLSSLYKLAYFGSAYWLPSDSLYGNYWPEPVFEVKDSSAFESNFEKGTGFYSYRLTMDSTKADLVNAKLAMQADLNAWFGFKVRLETRQLPVWDLVTVDQKKVARLKTRSMASSLIGDHSGMVLQKKTMQDVLRLIQSYHLDKHILDRTAFQGEIDIELNASLSSFSSLQAALQRNGLDLVLSTKPMKVLIISTP